MCQLGVELGKQGLVLGVGLMGWDCSRPLVLQRDLIVFCFCQLGSDTGTGLRREGLIS